MLIGSIRKPESMSGNVTKIRRRITVQLVVAALLLVSAAAACVPVPPGGGAGPTAGGGNTGQAVAKPGHVFVINLENKGYNEVWGDRSGAPYLSQTLRSKGVLLSEYYGIAHNSNPNYLAQISGQASNAMTRDDCPTYAAFRQTGTAALGQVEGTGCVYPASVPTVAGQLQEAGKTWKAYMEDMGTACRHPKIGAKDSSQAAKVGDEYATRHNPFVYFESITSSPDCQSNVVDFAELAGDLRSVETTPNLSYISPNLCNDGHDNPCVDGSPGGLTAADGWLSRQIPAILDSPAFRQDGMLVITFDEAEGKTVGPSALLPGGTAGGRIGALVLSPFTRGGTTSDRPYNHFSLLASIEDAFSLPRLGYAGAPGLNSFGADVFNDRP
jgi:phosphatidylinositol-3-phosphatase